MSLIREPALRPDEGKARLNLLKNNVDERTKTLLRVVYDFAVAEAKRFILREERNFVEIVDGTFGVSATSGTAA